jgi:hypothetical protein
MLLYLKEKHIFLISLILACFLGYQIVTDVKVIFGILGVATVGILLLQSTKKNLIALIVLSIFLEAVVFRLNLPTRYNLFVELFVALLVIKFIMQGWRIQSLNFVDHCIIFWIIYSVIVGFLYSPPLLALIFVFQKFKYFILYLFIKDNMKINSDTILQIILIIALLQVPISIIQHIFFNFGPDMNSGLLAAYSGEPFSLFYGVSVLILFSRFVVTSKKINVILILLLTLVIMIGSIRIGYLLLIFCIVSVSLINLLTFAGKAKATHVILTIFFIFLAGLAITQRDSIFEQIIAIDGRAFRAMQNYDSMATMVEYTRGIRKGGSLNRLEVINYFLNKSSLINILVGYGAGASDQFLSHSIQGYLNKRFGTTLISSGVNEIGETLFTSGIIGVLILLTIYYNFFRTGFSLKKERGLSLFLMSLPFCLLLLNFYCHLMMKNSTGLLFILLLLLNNQVKRT